MTNDINTQHTAIVMAAATIHNCSIHLTLEHQSLFRYPLCKTPAALSKSHRSVLESLSILAPLEYEGTLRRPAYQNVV